MAAGNSPPDDDLLRRTAAGDQDAFASLYGRYRGPVYRFAFQMSGSAEVAEEVVQEVFLVVMRKAGEFDSSRGRLSSWLYGIARRQAPRQLERRGGLLPFECLDDAEALSPPPELVTTFDPVESLTRQERAQLLREAILSLPPSYREVVVLCDLHEMSYAEAAAVTGCAVGTIRSRLHRSRALLQRKLAALGPLGGGRVRHGR